MTSARFQLQLPERQRNYRFALTPLADAMFQLLIFFMLSSSLTPYSMLTLQSAPAEEVETGGGGTGPQPGPAARTDLEVWRVTRGSVVAAGQPIDIDELGPVADALGASGRPVQLLLVVQRDARVQDVTTVLAQLSKAKVAGVQVSAEPD